MAAALVVVAGCGTDAAAPSQPESAPERTIANAAPGNTDTPVSTLVSDTDPAVAAALQIRSDALGVYSNSNTLTSVIKSVGAWVLDSKNIRNATRKVYLEFSQPLAGSGPGGGSPVGVPSGLYKVRAISKCNLYGTSMLTLAPGATMPCPLHIAFDYAGSAYAIQMNPNPAGDPEGAPETQPANITCQAPTSGAGPCTRWLIAPSGSFTGSDGTVQGRNVARLIRYVTSKNTTQNVNQGDFYFSFAIVVTNP